MGIGHDERESTISQMIQPDIHRVIMIFMNLHERVEFNISQSQLYVLVLILGVGADDSSATVSTSNDM